MRARRGLGADLDLVDPIAFVKDATDAMQPQIRKLAAKLHRDLPRELQHLVQVGHGLQRGEVRLGVESAGKDEPPERVARDGLHGVTSPVRR